LLILKLIILKKAYDKVWLYVDPTYISIFFSKIITKIILCVINDDIIILFVLMLINNQQFYPLDKKI